MSIYRTAFTSLCIAGMLLAVGIGCEMIGGSNSSEPDRPLVGPTWRLVAFEAADGSRTSVDPKYDRPRGDSLLPYYSLRFTEMPVRECRSTHDAKGMYCMEARAYPNEGFYTYTTIEDDQRLNVYFHGSTELGLLPGSKEPKFFQALDAANRYNIDGTRLRLASDDGKALLLDAQSTEEY